MPPVVSTTLAHDIHLVPCGTIGYVGQKGGHDAQKDHVRWRQSMTQGKTKVAEFSFFLAFQQLTVTLNIYEGPGAGS